jgi:transposase-like protein
MKNRVFTPEFKLSIVRALATGEKTVIQLCREHNLSDSLIHNWKKLYREKGEAAFTASTHSRASSSLASPQEQELQALRNKVAALERLIGQQTIELTILKKLSEVVNSSASKNGVK